MSTEYYCSECGEILEGLAEREAGMCSKCQEDLEDDTVRYYGNGEEIILEELPFWEEK